MQAELKRKQIEANAANEIQKQQIEATMKMQIAHIEAMERKEAEVQIEKEKEKQFLATEMNAKAQLEIQLANECQEKLKMHYEAKTKLLEQKLIEKAQIFATISETEPLSALPPVTDPGMICRPPAVTAPKIIPGKHSVMNSPPVCTQSALQGMPPLSKPFQRTLVQPPPMPACSTFVPPPAPAHVIPPPGVGMSAKSFGTSVVPALPPVVKAVPSMLMSATPTIPSVPNVTSLTQSLNVGTNVTFCSLLVLV